MKYKSIILLLSILVIALSCKKPCSEEPVGIDPLFGYSMQWEVSSENLVDAIDVLWEKDSVFLYSEDGVEIPFEWIEDWDGSNISERFFYYNAPEDDVAYTEEVTKTYYFEFRNFFGIDRDTLEIKFRAQKVTCGQVLDPLNFYFNGELIDEYYFGAGSKLLLKK